MTTTTETTSDSPLSARERALVLVLLISFCASGLFDHSLWTPNDSREGGMIAEMYRTGHWTALTLNGEPFLEKPPLLHWTALLLCSLAGGVSPGLVRVPAALFGLGTLLIVWAWGRRLGRERAGILGAFLCATNIAYYEYSRIVLTDIALTFALVFSIEAFWRAFAAEDGKAWRYALFVTAASLSFYAKGLIGPVFIMGSVVVFLALKRRWRLAAGLSLAFGALLIVAVLPWAAALYRLGGTEFLISAFVDNQLGRFFKLPTGAAVTALPVVGRWLGFMAGRPIPFDPYFVHKEPIYHYLLKLPVRLLPWTLLVVPALVHWFRRRGGVTGPFATLLRCAALTMLAILHGASAKAGNYALPLYPIFFLMVGVWCEDAGAAPLAKFENWMIGLTFGLVGAVAVAVPGFYLILFALPPAGVAWLERTFAASGAGASFGELSSLLWRPGAPTAWLGAFLCAAALVLSIWSMKIARERWAAQDPARGVLALTGTVAIVILLAGTAVMPAYDRQRSYRPVAELARDELAAGRRLALATHDAQIVGLFVFYTGERLPMIEPIPGTRAFLDGIDGPAGVIVRRDQLESIRESLRGIDHEVREVPADTGVNAREFCLITRG